MAQAQTIPADFLEMNDLMQVFLERVQADMAALSESSAEAFQGLKENVLKSWEKLPTVINDYKRSMQNMPWELRQRRFIKGLSKDIEAFEQDVRRYVAELKEAKLADVYRKALYSRTRRLAERIAELENHNLFQKFLKGEVILASKKSIQWGRKFAHAALGMAFLYIFIYSGFPQTVIWSIAGAYLIWSFSLETARHMNPRINEWVCKAFRPIMREREKTRVNSAIFYSISMAIVYFGFPTEVTVLTMLFIALGDPAAGIVGIYWGRKKLTQHSSLEGSLACFAVCALSAAICGAFLFEVSLGFFPLVLFAGLCGLVGAVAETSFKKFDDNLVMPLLSAPALWVLMQVFGII